ncbi:MAG: phosphoribosylglycinamide formyltransferase [Candidatus Marinimicrobia bacterium]|nr:phosphoribosylglycinamide formyltransferase [Candidatus Neomarinimicrobiota bacterium]
MLNIAVFASGRGSNYEAIQQKIDKGNINGKVVCVVSDHANPGVFERAKFRNIPTHTINRKQFKSGDDYVEKLLNTLADYNTDLIILAGYLKLIPTPLVNAYPHRMINIHPALLPNFGGKGYYGMNVHRAVVESGVNVTGITIHFVDEKYDNGSVILQKEVKVEPGDTPEMVAEKVLKLEHKYFPEVVRLLCDHKIKVIKNKVVIENE